MTKKKCFLIINRKGPYGSPYGRDALDVALVAATFNQHVRLLYMDDGVYQLLKNQNPTAISQKNSSKILPLLEMYEITEVYVERESLEARNLDQEDLAIPIQLISSSEAGALIDQSQILMGF